MLSVMLALSAFVGWGSGDIFATIASRRIGAVGSSFVFFTLGIVLFAVIIPFNLVPVPLIDVVQSAGLGLVLILASTCFRHALRTGNPTIVGTIGSSFAAVVVVLSLLFLHESITAGQLALITVILVGLVVTLLDLRSARAGESRLDMSLVFALATMVGWGVYFAFIKVPVRHVGWFWPSYISDIAGLAGLVALQWRSISESIPRWRSGMVASVASVVLVSGASFCYNGALEVGRVAIVAPLAGASPILFAVLSSLVFRASMTSQQKVGVGVTVVGIAGLSGLSA